MARRRRRRGTRRRAARRFGLGAQTPTFQRGAAIRTLLKDVPPSALTGSTCFTSTCRSVIRSPGRSPRSRAGRFRRASATMWTSMIAETKPPAPTAWLHRRRRTPGYGSRSRRRCKRIASESGVHIVASGGYYMQRNYPPDIATKSADQIADDLVRDASAQRLGAFGEIGQQGGVLHRRRAEGVRGGRQGPGAQRPADLHAQRLHRHAR